MNRFEEIERDMRRAIGTLTDDIAVIALDHYRAKFDEDGASWDGIPWELPDRRKPEPKYKHSSARQTEAILVDSGVLRDSIEVKTMGYGTVTFGSDLIYAQVHNEGLHAGRGAGFEMPKRQFLGMEEELDRKIAPIIEAELRRIFGK